MWSKPEIKTKTEGKKADCGSSLVYFGTVEIQLILPQDTFLIPAWHMVSLSNGCSTRERTGSEAETTVRQIMILKILLEHQVASEHLTL